jgi:hypothetical protein
MNRSDLIEDRVFSPVTQGQTRTLSDTIAHEQTHGLLRNFLGLKAFTAPNWKIEGYCDYIAQNGSLNSEQAAAIEKTNSDHPELVCFYGRKKVAAILKQNGGSVEKLFAE